MPRSIRPNLSIVDTMIESKHEAQNLLSPRADLSERHEYRFLSALRKRLCNICSSTGEIGTDELAQECIDVIDDRLIDFVRGGLAP